MEEEIINKVNCGLCHYSWETFSDLEYITCPSCRRKTYNTNKKEVK